MLIAAHIVTFVGIGGTFAYQVAVERKKQARDWVSWLFIAGMVVGGAFLIWARQWGAEGMSRPIQWLIAVPSFVGGFVLGWLAFKRT